MPIKWRDRNNANKTTHQESQNPGDNPAFQELLGHIKEQFDSFLKDARTGGFQNTRSVSITTNENDRIVASRPVSTAIVKELIKKVPADLLSQPLVNEGGRKMAMADYLEARYKEVNDLMIEKIADSNAAMGRDKAATNEYKYDYTLNRREEVFRTAVFTYRNQVRDAIDAQSRSQERAH
jgi:hypothetical protein